jgi:hypothetical protein
MSANPSESRVSHSCWDLCELPEVDLAKWDIAALNLAAAQGLPGLDKVDVAACLDRLDDWADRVKLETLRHVYRFDPQTRKPQTEFTYGNSLGRFCCYILLQVLQEDCGVVYNPARKFDPNFGDAADLFIHGILDENGHGGTCATMPVVYVAVARRLGYPVKLVEGRGHLFFRWDDPRGTVVKWDRPETTFWIPPDRFNVEGAGEGIAYYPDSYYIQWPKLWTETDFEHGRYLRSQTVKEELAGFLVARGECWYEYALWNEALKAYHYARQLVPDDRRYDWLHAKRSAEYERHRRQELERILEINERNRLALEHQKAQSAPPPPRTVKIAFGAPYPNDLPPGTVVQWVPPEQADVGLPVGRSLRVAAGRPLPRNLPPGVSVVVVTPDLADPLPPEFDAMLPESPKTMNDPFADHFAQLKRIHEQNRRLLDEKGPGGALRPW